MQLAAATQGNPDPVRQVEQGSEPAWTEEIDAHVGSRLRARRIAVGLSQSALGRHLGLTFSQVQKYEKGSNRIGAGRLYHLAALLGVSVHYFYEGLENSPPDPNGATPVATAETARLQEAFERISDPYARQALLSLALSMVKSS
jgi:transcriptional regulator with XRE-family HTH domain